MSNAKIRARRHRRARLAKQKRHDAFFDRLGEIAFNRGAAGLVMPGFIHKLITTIKVSL
jgi:hypothetical protein